MADKPEFWPNPEFLTVGSALPKAVDFAKRFNRPMCVLGVPQPRCGVGFEVMSEATYMEMRKPSAKTGPGWFRVLTVYPDGNYAVTPEFQEVIVTPGARPGSLAFPEPASHIAVASTDGPAAT